LYQIVHALFIARSNLFPGFIYPNSQLLNEILLFASIFRFLGWQPGIQETAYAWDEEWDRFGDEGMLASILILPPCPLFNACLC
jgi:hypothetical protein